MDTADTPSFDLLVIGGGINGAGIARDAAGRGYSVCLCDAGDFGGATSSASTKLIHGGLRYLEHYEFRLVREALRERARLWSIAPHIIHPMRFVLPHVPGMRPAWLLRLGLFLYDHIGGRGSLPPTRAVSLEGGALGAPLKPGMRRGWEYSDAWVDDARLVVLNLVDAARKGADIRSRTRATRARAEGDRWRVTLQRDGSGDGNGDGGGAQDIHARMVVNAAGAHVDEVLRDVFGHNAAAQLRLVRGSHIVVPRKADHDRAYIFQQEDGRIIFAIPYEEAFTLIGTTDVDQGRSPREPVISEEETAYLCTAASQYFTAPVTPEDVVWTYSGLRALVDDGASAAQEATRDYVLKLAQDGAAPPLLNVLGGKITTYRRLAEAALSRIGAALGPVGAPWTGAAALPGGAFPRDGREALTAHLAARFAFVPLPIMARLVRAYGTRVPEVLGDAGTLADLGPHLGAGLFAAEVEFMCREEWAETAQDVLYRRSKLGLHMTAPERDAVAAYLAQRAVG